VEATTIEALSKNHRR